MRGNAMTMRFERRRPALASDFLLRVAIAWAMIAGLLLVTNLPRVVALRPASPLDATRLEALQTGWPAFRELPLAGLSRLLGLVMDPQVAGALAALLLPFVVFGIALLLGARIAWRVIGDEASGLTCLAMALSVPVLAAMQPLRVDFDGLQIVCALLAMNGLMDRAPRRGGWLAGGALAAWLAVSLAALPLVLAICAVVAWRWLACRQDRAWLVCVLQGLAIGAAMLATVGGGTVAPCGSLGFAHAAGLGALAVGAMLLAMFEPLPRPFLAGGLVASAMIGSAVAWSFDPSCAGAALGAGVPVWQQTAGMALQIVVPPLVAVVAALQLAGRSSEWLRRWWNGYAFVVLAALALSLFDARAAAVAGALAAVPLGWQLREWLRAARHLRRPGKRAVAMTGMALAMVPALPLTVAAAV